MQSAVRVVLLVSIFFGLAGCPDRSMLRPYPDLSKQNDSDSGDTIIDDAEQAESGDGQAPE